MAVEVNSFAPAGSRVASASVGGRPLDQTAFYTLAVNDFMVAGGDGYTILSNATRIIDLANAQLTASQVISAIEAARTVSPVLDGRMVMR